VPVPDCGDCLKAVQRASAKPHPPDIAVELRKQTENKLDVLADYYAAWPNTILNGLRKFPPKGPVHLWIIDLFAGRGWHESATRPEARRPGTAAAAGFRLWQAVTRSDWPFEVHGHVVAVDADATFEAELHATLDRFAHPRLDVRILAKNCAEVIEDLRRESLGGYTLWLFDPYGLESIPLCLIRKVLGDKKTELIVNLDAGNAQRVIDAAVKKAGTHDLSKVTSPTLDCLFGGDAWREVPAEMTSTARREAWLADQYADLFSPPMLTQSLPMESSSGFTRFLVQAATHPTARDRFRKSYDDVQRLWKKPRQKLDDLARVLAHDLAGQEVTPELIQTLGIFPGASLERIRGACHQALHLGLASSCDPDGKVALLPLADQPNAPKGLFD
jgi:three-Cys-motif partner protein